MIPLAYVAFGSMFNKKSVRDKYSVFTFMFLILTLLVRTLSIIPTILDHEEKLPSNKASCLEFTSYYTPIHLFTLAAMVQTARWFKVRKKLILGTQYTRQYDVMIVTMVLAKLLILPMGYCIF